MQTSEKPTAPVAYPELNGERPVTDGWLPDRAVSAGAGSAGSVAADAPDIARWGYDLYAAHRVVSRADVAAMTSPTSLGGSYGLGTVLYPAAGDAGLDEPAVGHDGEIARFTAGAQYGVYTSYLLVVPSEHVSVAILGPELVTLAALSHLAGALVRAAGGH